jgi:hypothetical protein
MRTITPSIENRLAEHHRGLPVWIHATKTGQEYYTGLTRAKLYELAGRGLIRSVSFRDPGNLKGCRFFHLQSMLDYLERAEQREKHAGQGTDPETAPAPIHQPPLKGQTVFLANALTGGGNEYLIGVFASESDAWLASQRELNQGRKVWIEPHVVGRSVRAGIETTVRQPAPRKSAWDWPVAGGMARMTPPGQTP